MNRSAQRARIFGADSDYALFVRLLAEALQRRPMRLLAYAVMPTHWHLLLWPADDTDLPRFMQWLTRVHAQRWNLAHQCVGRGSVYQGRFKAIPIQGDEHFLTVCTYIERNPLRANLVERATDWRWSSAWTGTSGHARPAIAKWPLARPADWAAHLNSGTSEAREVWLRERIRQGLPFGGAEWTATMIERLRLTGRQRGRGRPSVDDGRP